MTARDDEAAYLRLALAEAIKGQTSPNPHVGALVVANGEIVGRGHHPRAGREHAEVVALREAGARARGATLYVTLEPCNHHGRTPPCTDAVLAAGIARVVVGVRDPNPNVAGGGNERLRAAGVEVVEGVEHEACARIIRPFAKHARTRRPWVRLKLAASLDGRIAAATGVSKWITGAEARRRVHATRAMVDAIAVGIGTALADDPTLTVRDVPMIEGHDPPVRIVFDPSARLPIGSTLVQTAREVPTRVIVGTRADARALEDHGVLITRADSLAEALDALGALSIVDLLVEGGARLAGSLIKDDLVDELQWYVAPIALGERGIAALIGPSPDDPSRAPRYALESVERVGDDIELTLLRAHP
jgi:diaminohydroxyphosphoribosylaminopyrimidine deaminase/5-amino-6-(5-phosphoribosylamino)uracil reductase